MRQAANISVTEQGPAGWGLRHFGSLWTRAWPALTAHHAHLSSACGEATPRALTWPKQSLPVVRVHGCHAAICTSASALPTHSCRGPPPHVVQLDTIHSMWYSSRMSPCREEPQTSSTTRVGQAATAPHQNMRQAVQMASYLQCPWGPCCCRPSPASSAPWLPSAPLPAARHKVIRCPWLSAGRVSCQTAVTGCLVPASSAHSSHLMCRCAADWLASFSHHKIGLDASQ